MASLSDANPDGGLLSIRETPKSSRRRLHDVAPQGMYDAAPTEPQLPRTRPRPPALLRGSSPGGSLAPVRFAGASASGREEEAKMSTPATRALGRERLGSSPIAIVASGANSPRRRTPSGDPFLDQCLSADEIAAEQASTRTSVQSLRLTPRVEVAECVE